MHVVATRDQRWMRQTEAVLLASGIESRWAAGGDGRTAVLDIAVSDTEQVADLLSEQLGEDLRRRRPAAEPLPPLLLQPAFAVALCLAAVLVTFFWVTGPFDLRVGWFRQGALVGARAWEGEWWRLVTAATLHADGRHALGNALFIVVLGWAVAERVGPGAMLLLAVLTAMGGFVASMWFSDATVTVGASGGLFGLLGVAAGDGLARPSEALHRRQHVLRILGAALMLLAFTAFDRESNIAAHVGGFVTGLALGLVFPRRLAAGPSQPLFGAAAAALVAGAWLAA